MDSFELLLTPYICNPQGYFDYRFVVPPANREAMQKMPQNTGEAYAENTLTKLIAAHREMQIAIDATDDEDQVDWISNGMMALEADISVYVPRSKQDAISKLVWLAGLYPDDQYSVLRQALDSLGAWARALP